jgi:hypothetical protein
MQLGNLRAAMHRGKTRVDFSGSLMPETAKSALFNTPTASSRKVTGFSDNSDCDNNRQGTGMNIHLSQ